MAHQVVDRSDGTPIIVLSSKQSRTHRAATIDLHAGAVEIQSFQQEASM